MNRTERDARLFIDNNIHDYLFYTELSIVCFYAQDWKVGIEVFTLLFNNAEKIRISEFELAARNLIFFLSHIHSSDLPFYKSFCKYYDNYTKRKLTPPVDLKKKIDKIFKINITS